MISEPDRCGLITRNNTLDSRWEPNSPETGQVPRDHIQPQICFAWPTLPFFLNLLKILKNQKNLIIKRHPDSHLLLNEQKTHQYWICNSQQKGPRGGQCPHWTRHSSLVLHSPTVTHVTPACSLKSI